MAKKNKKFKKPVFKSDFKFPMCDLLYRKMEEHSVWYAGEADLLADFYRKTESFNIFNTQYQIKRNNFWAKTKEDNGTPPVHIPIASSMCELSADILFKESPSIRLDNAFKEKTKEAYKDSQDELDSLLAEMGLNQQCLQGSETQAALGGVYLKLCVNDLLVKRPIIQVGQPDNAVPTFSFGILTEVTFFSIVKIEKPSVGSTNHVVWRLAETYNREGQIMYQLFKGCQDKLGEETTITALPVTKYLKDLDYNYDGMLCVYVPNMLPNRLDRKSSLGRSDYQGIEPLMGSLDEAYSSWMRDVKLSKAKLVVPASFLEPVETGDSTADSDLKYDTDTALYALLNIDPLTSSEKNVIQAVQFAIRADEFEKTCLNLIERIVSAAGYSPQSFGLNIQGRVESGEALKTREKRTNDKKVKKESFWTNPLRQLIQATIHLANTKFGYTIKDDSNITIEFSKGISASITEISDAVKKVSEAKAASRETLVKMLHQDWPEDQILEEVARIEAESEKELEDPTMSAEYEKYKASLEDNKTKDK